jgi:hypothetical protein
MALDRGIVAFFLFRAINSKPLKGITANSAHFSFETSTCIFP